MNGNRQNINTRIETIANRYQQTIYYRIIPIVRSHVTAQDIIQQAFLKALRAMQKGEYNETGELLNYITRIARNLAMDHLRKQKKQNTALHGSFDHDIFNSLTLADSTAEEKVIKGQVIDQVRQLIARLPDEQQQIIEMRYYQGMKFKGIAQQTDTSINTIIGRNCYAINNMRKMIDKFNITLI